MPLKHSPRSSKFLFLSLLLAAAAASAADFNVGQPLESALTQARAKHVPVIAEFHAPWCYSCYYMARNVLNGAEWEQVTKSTVLLELDADSREGAHWMQTWDVKVLPTYVVLDEQGRELGRILGEQTRPEFYRRLSAILRQSGTLETLKAQAVDSGDASVAAVRDVLRTYHARNDAAAGIAWFETLPPVVLSAVVRDAATALWISRLELLRASGANEIPACLKAGRTVLSSPALSCERPYELPRYLACAKSVPEEQRLPLLKTQADRLATQLDQRVFADGARCADERSLVLATADLYREMNDTSAESLTLLRAVADARTRLGPDVTADRNLADNVRVYLERANRAEDYEAWMQRLIAAFPDDYVYPYRYGKWLLAQNRAADALPYLEAAAPKSYGANRLKVAQQQVQALIAVNRAADARKLGESVLKANGPWFADDAAKLRELIPSA